MVATVELQVEVVGCPTVCRHCWAQGVPYPAMPVDDIARVLEQAYRFCDDHRLGFGAYPMHELAAHPQAAQVLRVFADHVGAAEFEPLSTTGVPLAVRGDWQELLAAAARLGTTTVWVAFHGLGVEHDRQVNRPGAFTETCLAVQRVHAVGLRAGANVFVTTANGGQAERLLGVLQRLQVDEMAWEPPTYYPTPRGRRNEGLRPGASELVPLADRICQLSPFHADAWATWRPTPRRPGWPGHWPATGHRRQRRWSHATAASGCRWCAVRASMCTPVWPAGTGSGTATCGATAPKRCSAAPYSKAGGPSTRSGSGRSGCRRLRSWLPAMATGTGRGCTSPRRRFATFGWIGVDALILSTDNAIT